MEFLTIVLSAVFFACLVTFYAQVIIPQDNLIIAWLLHTKDIKEIAELESSKVYKEGDYIELYRNDGTCVTYFKEGDKWTYDGSTRFPINQFINICGYKLNTFIHIVITFSVILSFEQAGDTLFGTVVIIAPFIWYVVNRLTIHFIKAEAL